MPRNTFETLEFYHIDLSNFIKNYRNYMDFINANFQGLAFAALEAQKKKSATFKTAVGAAVQTKGLKIFSAGNIENLSRCQDDHAEKRAVAKAIEEGCKKEQIVALCLVYGNKSIGGDDIYAYPACGACRQYIWENANPQTDIIVTDPESEEMVFAAPLRILYPLPYPKWEDIPQRLKDPTGKTTQNSQQTTKRPL